MANISPIAYIALTTQPGIKSKTPQMVKMVLCLYYYDKKFVLKRKSSHPPPSLLASRSHSPAEGWGMEEKVMPRPFLRIQCTNQQETMRLPRRDGLWPWGHLLPGRPQFQAQGPKADALATTQFLETYRSGITRGTHLTWALRITPVGRSQLLRSGLGTAGSGHTARACLLGPGTASTNGNIVTLPEVFTIYVRAQRVGVGWGSNA